MNSFIKTASGMAIVIDNKPYNVDNTHPNYEKIVEAVKDKDYDAVPGLVNMSIALTAYCRGKVTVDVNQGVILYNNQVLHNCLVDRIFSMMREGFDIQPMVLFLENLLQNPSKRAVDELYLFLEYGRLPITEDGCFIAYKRVNDDYMDCHTRKVLNKPYDLVTEQDLDAIFTCPEEDNMWWHYTTERGVTVTLQNEETIVAMARNAVDDNRDRTCSEGLHFCSHEYLRSFGGARTVILKINPADVVSIPSDYNNTKGRACKYVVIGELDADQKDRAERENVFTQAVYGRDEDMEDLYPEDDDTDYDSGVEVALNGDGVMYIVPPTDHSSVVDYGHSDEYIQGYSVGYADGKNKRKVSRDTDTFDGYTVQQCKDINEGYNVGYKDGRGHKRRLYK